MSKVRFLWLLVGAGALAACGGGVAVAPLPPPTHAPGEPPRLLGEPVPQPEPEPASEPLPPPEPSARERWSAPFAVQSAGRMSPRPLRATVVLRMDSVAISTPDTLQAPASDSAVLATAASPSPPADAPARRPAASREPRSHRVESGETWYGIARRYGVAPSALRAANPRVDPDRIRSGQTLRIPRPGAAAGAASARTHRVAEGESLWVIARRYEVTVAALRRANRLEGDRLRPGQTLIIPD